MTRLNARRIVSVLPKPHRSAIANVLSRSA
jgi:hypothetical protein